MKTFQILSIAFGLSTLVAANATGSFRAPVVGEPAPAFSLLDTKGVAHKLSDYAGKNVILEWTNHECPFVKKHYGSGNMQKLQAYAKTKGFVWLSIVSSAQGREGFGDGPTLDSVTASQKAVPTAKLLDPQGIVGHAYGAKTTPHMFVIDKTGKLVYSGGIDDKRSPDPADIPGAFNYVKAAIDEISAGKAVSHPTSQPYGCSVKY